MSRDIGGGNRYRVATDVASLDITGTALTLAAWYFPQSTAAFHVILSKGGSGSATQYALGRNSGGNVYGTIGDGAGEDLLTGGALTQDVWNHAAYVKNGTGAGAGRVFANGSVTTGTSNRSIQNTANVLRIGILSSDDTSFPADGPMADLAIWNVALTDDEVAALAKGFSPLLIRPQSLQGHWPLLGAGDELNDTSKNGNALTRTGTPALIAHPRIIMPSEALYVP